MSSSIEEEFQPPEWATKEEVIKAACHYINYWKIEARSRNQQWLDALQGEANAKRCETSLRGELDRKHKELAILQSARERDVAEVKRLKAENEELHKDYEALADEHTKLTNRKAEADRLKAEVERLRKAGDEMAWAFGFAVSRNDGEPSGLIKAWNAAKEGKPGV